MNIVFELQYCMNLSLVCTEYDFAFYTYILIATRAFANCGHQTPGLVVCWSLCSGSRDGVNSWCLCSQSTIASLSRILFEHVTGKFSDDYTQCALPWHISTG